MRRSSMISFILSVFLMGTLIACSSYAGETVPANGVSMNRGPAVEKRQIQSWGGTGMAEPFKAHGRLSVKGADLVDADGASFQLKGVSTHGLQWFPQYVSEDTFHTLKTDWGANAVRLAMYTKEGGYIDGNRSALEAVIDRGVQAAYSQSMYVIIDWHILSDGNPNQYTAEAKDFFSRMSLKYAGYGNVLYEICNEPNGGVSMQDIKTYADQIIPAIRANDASAVILVGTPNWSQYPDEASAYPAAQPANVMYTLHFYAGTHKDDIRNRLIKARELGVPVFISEYSICDASGNGGTDLSSAAQWKQLISQYNISCIAWSLCNKAETSALLKTSCSKVSGFTDADLSETGLWVKQMISGR